MGNQIKNEVVVVKKWHLFPVKVIGLSLILHDISYNLTDKNRENMKLSERILTRLTCCIEHVFF